MINKLFTVPFRLAAPSKIVYSFTIESPHKKQLNPNNPFFKKSLLASKSNRVFTKKTNQEEEILAKQKLIGEEKQMNLEDILSKINITNAYFQGIKLNTNYLKVQKSVRYDDIKSHKSTDQVTITDFPLAITNKVNPINQKVDDIQELKDVQNILNKKAAQILFQRVKYEKAETRMQSLVKQYIEKLIQKDNRIHNLQPNFQLSLIKTMNSLSDKYRFVLQEESNVPDVRITNITLMKGVFVNRNNNYSIDSFSIEESQKEHGIYQYKLFLQKNQQYPEAEWHSTFTINARIEAIVRSSPVIEVYQGENKIGTSKEVGHAFIFETDLVKPPLNSMFALTPQEYLKSYRFDLNALKITNVDRKNPYYALTYSQDMKKSTLINQII